MTSLADDLYGDDDTPDPARDEWLAWRREGIGGSDVAAILGLSPWAGPWTVWADKLGLVPPEPESEPMRWGKLLEPVIAAEVAHRTGLEVAGEQMWCVDREHPHRRSTIDGLLCPQGYESLDEAVAVLEMKNTSAPRWDNDEVPLMYHCQVQHQLAVTGFQRAVVAVLHAGNRLALYSIEADPEDQKRIAEAVDTFWLDHVVPKVQPAAMSRDLERLKRLPSVEAETLEADSELRALIEQHKAAKEAVGQAEDWCDQLAARIIAKIGPAEVVTIDGNKALTCRPRRELDTPRIAAVRPEVWAQAIEATAPKPSLTTLRKLLGKDAAAFELVGARSIRY